MCGSHRALHPLRVRVDRRQVQGRVLKPVAAETVGPDSGRARARAHTELAAGYYELGNMVTARSRK